LDIVSDLVTNGKYIFAEVEDSIYRSSNNGESWGPVNTDSFYLGHGYLVVHNSFLFVGNSQGIFRSSNNGNKLIRKC